MLRHRCRRRLLWRLRTDHGHEIEPGGLGALAAIMVIANDGLLAPLILLTGAALLRAPAGARAYLQSGLVISGSVTLVAVPLLLGFGRSLDLPSALPLNYGQGLAITLGLIGSGSARSH